MSNPAEMLGGMETEKCPLNLATKRSLLILAREVSGGNKDWQPDCSGLRSEWDAQIRTPAYVKCSSQSSFHHCVLSRYS